MKKAISLFMAVMLLLSLCACGGASLSAEQKAACEEADAFFKGMLDALVPGSKVTSTVKVVSGKTLYYCTLDIKGTFDAAAAFKSAVMPTMESTFAKHNMYVVIHIKENGKDAYRLIDSRLDPNILG